MIKVLFVSHSNSLGGAELCLLEMIKLLFQTGQYSISIVIPKHLGVFKNLCKPFVSDIYEVYLPYWVDDKQVGSFLKNNLREITQTIVSTLKVSKFLKQVEPDLVLTNTSVIPQFAIACKLLKIKHIWFIHELVEVVFGLHYVFGRRFSKRLIGFLSDKVITNSYFVHKIFQPFVSKKKLIMIYQPVLIKFKGDKILKTDDTEFRLLIVGKITDFKGQDQAVKASVKLLESGVNVRLTVVGNQDDAFLIFLKNLIPTSFLQHIHFVQFVDDISTYYLDADIALVCSRFEALGRVTIEAMKAGLPIVASNTGANPELVKDGFNGYLYEYGSVDDLVDKILLLKDSKQLILFGENGRKWANMNFNSEKFANEMYSLFFDLSNK